MGLTNAPVTFQAMMNEILKEFLNLGIVCYLDDILIYSWNKAEHETLVKLILQKFIDHGLAVEIDKCLFHVQEVDFLDYILSPEGVKMANDWIRTILDWEPPKSVKDVQVFIGFANFYRRFIYDFLWHLQAHHRHLERRS